jgi:hypothetical protein
MQTVHSHGESVPPGELDEAGDRFESLMAIA